MFGGGFEAAFDLRPVHHVPPGLDVVSLDVQVVQIERVLPHIQHEQRNLGNRNVRLLVEQLEDDGATRHAVPSQYRPARALQSGSGGGEVLLEGFKRTEVFINRCSEFAAGTVGGVGSRTHHFPKGAVVRVSAQVESEVLFELVNRGKVAGRAGFFELFQSRVRAVYIVGVVLVVVQLHDFAGDVRLQSSVIVGEFGEGVNRHVLFLTVAVRSGLTRRLDSIRAYAGCLRSIAYSKIRAAKFLARPVNM